MLQGKLLTLQGKPLPWLLQQAQLSRQPVNTWTAMLTNTQNHLDLVYRGVFNFCYCEDHCSTVEGRHHILTLCGWYCLVYCRPCCHCIVPLWQKLARGVYHPKSSYLQNGSSAYLSSSGSPRNVFNLWYIPDIYHLYDRLCHMTWIYQVYTCHMKYIKNISKSWLLPI
jgi:hypothetical protein